MYQAKSANRALDRPGQPPQRQAIYGSGFRVQLGAA